MSAQGKISAIWLLLLMLTSVQLWSQDSNTPQVSNGQGGAEQQQAGAPAESNSPGGIPTHPEDRMQTPPPVGVQSYPIAFSSEEQANYLRYGAALTTAHTDNALFGISKTPVSDVSYSIAPTISIDETTSRLHWVATYAPGFTFYQRISEYNEADQNASLEFTYRLSPHITFAAEDRFQKSSNVFNQPNIGSALAVSGATQVPNLSVVSPVASRLSNTGSVGLTYQFSLNQMVGASGTFTTLDYPDPSQVPGLFNSNSQAGSGFYSFRVSRMHYIGATYQYQRLLAYPTEGQSETQTHAALFFYTLYPSAHFSMSIFGGPQYSDTIVPPSLPAQPLRVEVKSWDPAAGASLNWQGRFTSLALSYSRVIAPGGGLVGAAHTDSAGGIIRRQITRRLSGAVNAGYAQNRVIAGTFAGSENGHTVFGTASLQQSFGQHLNAAIGYTRLHQSYSQIAVLAATPDTNREFISISYLFSRPLGR
jgi:hypothetical protein